MDDQLHALRCGNDAGAVHRIALDPVDRSVGAELGSGGHGIARQGADGPAVPAQGEILAADHILIATPVYNYNVPASLKAWVDHIVRKGMTLGHDGKGLVTDKSATVLIASGGVYTEGLPIRDLDIATLTICA